MTPPDERLAEMLVNRVRRNLRRLRPWLAREGITCYRIYDRDIPEIPLAVDWYEGRLHAAVYEGPRDGLGPGAAALVGALAEALGVDRGGVFVKARARQRGGAQYEKVGRTGARFVVREGGLEFAVNLGDYLDSGLFLDHRRTRALVREEARGRRFLNLFAYTGAFSVYAAAGGAASTLTVDMSNTYLDWARENMRLNGFTGAAHRFERADAVAFLAAHRPPHAGYDLVVIDPPTVSRSKKMARKLDLERDHPALLGRALALCRPGGVVYFSTNFRRFRLRADEIRCSALEEITARTTPFDFRDRRIHRCFRLVV